MEVMFRKSLADLVRGIRQNKKDEEGFINKALQEIKEELRLTNKKVKMIAVQKLTYLHMLGYDTSWAAFNIIEVMSQPTFTAKRIGYLAAGQTFTGSTDVLMLATNLFKKDISSSNPYETGVAINSLSNVCTADLARDLAPDIVTLLTSSRSYVRKKSVLVLYKVFLQFPQALRPAFPRLKEKLEDPDMSVVSGAVNVICELARKNPKNYLALAPVLFKILTVSTNNWMLIKIIKLFGALAPLEPRLAKKLVDPITNIINSTTAMSLLYECIQTCTIGLAGHPSVIRLCIAKLRLFIEDPDQNLKYLGLLALSKLMKIAPKAVQEHKDTVMTCLDDEDITIRMRSLDLIVGMVNKRNLMDIVKKLMEKLEDADGTYKDELVDKIINICSQGNYQFILDFEWYITVLVELTHVHGTKHGLRISDQLMDVTIRVKIIREFAVASMINLLHDTRLTGENPVEGGICEVVFAAGWIIGEFIEYGSNFCAILDGLLNPRISALPGHIQAVNIQNSIKVFAYIANHCAKTIAESPVDSLESAIQIMKSRLPLFTKSSDLETQERSCLALELVNLTESVGGTIASDIIQLFAEPLNPVAEKAQRKVPVPPGLNLEQQIHTPPSSDDESEPEDNWAQSAFETPKSKADDQRDMVEERKRQQQRRANDPFYLGGRSEGLEDSEEYPPVETITGDMIDLKRPPQMPRSGHKLKRVQVMTTEEMPEGAGGSSDEDLPKDDSDIFAGIDLVTSLKPEEELKASAYPTPQLGFAHQDPFAVPGLDSKPGSSEKKSKRRKHREGKHRDRGDRGERAERGDGERRRRKHRGADSESQPGRGNDIGDLLGLSGQAPASPVSSPVVRQQAAPAPSTPSRQASGPVNFAIHSAGETQHLQVTYELGVNPQQADKVMSLFHIRAGAKPLSNFEFSFVDNASIRLMQPADLTPALQIAPGQVQDHRLLFQFKSFLQPLKISASIAYSAQGEAGRLNFELTLPCSAFVQPQDIDHAQFMALSGSLPSASSKARCADPKQGLLIISESLHVKVVKVTDVATLYGRSTQNHHVCVFVKNRNGGFNLEVKASDASFAENLLQDIKVALRKHL